MSKAGFYVSCVFFLMFAVFIFLMIRIHSFMLKRKGSKYEQV